MYLENFEMGAPFKIGNKTIIIDYDCDSDPIWFDDDMPPLILHGINEHKFYNSFDDEDLQSPQGVDELGYLNIYQDAIDNDKNPFIVDTIWGKLGFNALTKEIDAPDHDHLTIIETPKYLKYRAPYVLRTKKEAMENLEKWAGLFEKWLSGQWCYQILDSSDATIASDGGFIGKIDYCGIIEAVEKTLKGM